MRYRKPTILILALALPSCSFYESDALNPAALFSSRPADTIIDTVKLQTPALQTHPFNAADGLEQIEVAQLAVLNNPDLKLARDDAAIAQAQAFSAGLLPDPQLGLALDRPTNKISDMTNAYSAGLTYDFSSLLKLPSTLAASRADNKKTDLNLLWQELQTISQAKLLFVRTVSQDKSLAALKDYHAFLTERRTSIIKAIDEHRIANDSASAVLAAYDDISTKLHDAEKQADKNHRDLNAFLGLEPTSVLELVGNDVPDFDNTKLPGLLESLPKRRPDLLALEEGYNSQDKKYIGALLGQFPALNVGFNRARDTSNVTTNGFALTLSLPIFNRNQGAIAVEKATRQRLHDEYQTRVTKAHEEIDALESENNLTKAQYANSQMSLAQWQKTLTLSEQGLKAHNIDLFTYTNLRNSGLTKQLDVIALKAALEEQAIGLEILSGQELPAKDATP